MNKLILAVIIALLAGAGLATLLLRNTTTNTTAPVATVQPPVPSQRVRGSLSAEAHVIPIRSATLSLPIAGQVGTLLVAEGQHVEAGQTLVQLNPARAEAALAQAQAELATAQAREQQLRVGATPAALAIAEAQLHAAQAKLRQTRGSVTPADRQAAEATLQQARAELTALQAGPVPSELRAAEASLAQAQANLITQRNALSAAKTTSQLEVERATNALTIAQASYASATQNWQYVQDSGRDPISPYLGIDPKNGSKIPNTVGDAQRQQYYAAFIQAQAALHSAETALQQAQVAAENALQAEVSSIQAAEQDVKRSQASLDTLRTSSTLPKLAAARAKLATSQATLDKLNGDQQLGSLAAAQASVDQAQASLDQLRASAAPSDLAIVAAQVAQAQASLQLAQIARSETELHAPFRGTIAAILIQPGEYAIPGTPAIQLADLATWQIETNDLTEQNVARIQIGSKATITFDALPDLELHGTVRAIRPLGESKQGDITYRTTIALEQSDPRLRWNMTASVTFEP